MDTKTYVYTPAVFSSRFSRARATREKSRGACIFGINSGRLLARGARELTQWNEKAPPRYTGLCPRVIDAPRVKALLLLLGSLGGTGSQDSSSRNIFKKTCTPQGVSRDWNGEFPLLRTSRYQAFFPFSGYVILEICK